MFYVMNKYGEIDEVFESWMDAAEYADTREDAWISAEEDDEEEEFLSRDISELCDLMMFDEVLYDLPY